MKVIKKVLNLHYKVQGDKKELNKKYSFDINTGVSDESAKALGDELVKLIADKVESITIDLREEA